MYGKNYHQSGTRAPVCSATANRTFAATSVQDRCYVRASDVPAAYMQGKTTHKVLLIPPVGWEEPRDKHGQRQCWVLLTNLHGCQPAGSVWGKEIRNKFMVKEQGFEACPADPCVFRKDVWIRPDTANVTEGEFDKSQLQSAQSRLASACSNKPRE